MLQSPTLSTTDVERALDAVLARPEYAPVEPPPLYRLLGAIADWWRGTVWPLFSRLLPDIDWTSPAWERFGTMALAVGAMVGLALIIYLVVLAVRAWRGRVRRARATGESGGLRPLTAVEWEARAGDAAGRGDWREAAQALYQAVVLRLGERGVVRVDRAKTPGDYRREVRRGSADFLPRLEPFLVWFERVAYGRAEPGPEHYDRLRSTARALVANG